MPVPMAVAQGNYTPSQPSNNQTGAPNTAGAASAIPSSKPFKMAAQRHLEQGASQSIVSTSWSTGANVPFLVPTHGYMRSLFLTFQGTGGAKGATVTVAGSADAPWNLLQAAQVADSSGTPIVQLDGYALFLAMTYGGYSVFRPDGSSFGFTPIDGTAGSGTGTGDFKLKYELPFEFGTDGLGSLPNMDASAQYRVSTTLNGPAVFYNGSADQPATLPNITGLIELSSYAAPPATDQFGAPQATQPPALGTVSYWTSETQPVQSGQNTIYFHRTGNIIRNHIFVFRDSSGSRANADSTGVTPSVIEFDWDSFIRFKSNVDTQRQINFRLFGSDVPAGVIVYPNAIGPQELQGHEYGLEWMQTLGSTLLKLQFQSSAAGTIQIITNDIVPASNAVFTAPMLAL